MAASREKVCSAQSDGFQIVHRKKGRRQQKLCTPTAESTSKENDDEVDVSKLRERIQQCRDEIVSSEFYTLFLRNLEEAVQTVLRSTDPLQEEQLGKTESGVDKGSCGVNVLVYGLGNFATCLIARYQLSLLLALREHWKLATAACQTYDPRFTETEKQMVTDYGCTLIQHNEEGKRKVDGPTIALMPHCGKALFNNFLWANWSSRQLQQLVVVGNSFSSMLDSIPGRLWDQRIYYVAAIQPFCKERPVVNNFRHTDIFNDLSVHWFPETELQKVPLEVWTDISEPVNDADDVEIILAENR